MINNISIIVSMVISLVALSLSIFNLRLERRKVVNEFISRNRIDWIKDMRVLLTDFIERYYREERKDVLRSCKIKIDLYIRQGDPVYEQLNRILETCIENSFNTGDYQQLIKESQTILGDVWTRMKDEAGVKRKKEKKYKKKFIALKSE